MLCTLGPLFSRPTLFSFLLSSPKPGRTPEDLFCPSFSPPFGPYFPLSSYLRACRNGGVAIETGICKKEAMCRVCCIYRTHARKGGELDSTKKSTRQFFVLPSFRIRHIVFPGQLRERRKGCRLASILPRKFFFVGGG